MVIKFFSFSLEAYERNQNFVPPQVILAPAVLTEWPSSGFHQLTDQHRAVLPALSLDNIRTYLQVHQSSEPNNNINLKAIEKGQSLVDSNRVAACSFVGEDEEVYFSCIVRAAMKKKVSYNLKLKLNTSGEVLNSHCECPAGKGPHSTCKHIAAVCLMLSEFVSSGKLQVERTCTDNLQTFHHPRNVFSGSPMKTEDFPIRGDVTRLLFDPRPAQYRNLPSYQDHVHNLVTNYCAQAGHDLAVRYLLPRADLQSASSDHDYFESPFTYYMVDTATNINDSDILAVERSTRQQSGCKQWFQHRSWRLTASNFGTICKMTSKRNVQRLCEQLLNPPKLHTPAIIHGRQHEQAAIKEFEKKMQMTVKKCGLFIGGKPYSFIAATPDGLVGNDHVIEVKCPYSGRDSPISPGKKFPYLYTCSESGEINLKKCSSYYIQVQGQLFLTKRQHCYFVVYTFVDCKVFEVTFDEEFVKHSVIPKLQLFYEKYYRPHIASTL